MSLTFDTRTAALLSPEHPGYGTTFKDPGSPFRYPPTNPQVIGTASPTAKTWDQLEVTWGMPFSGSPTGYTVEWKYENDNWLNPGDVGYTGVTVTGLSHTFTTINADSQFIDVRVRAVYGPNDESYNEERPYAVTLFGTFTGSALYRMGSWVDSYFVMHPRNAQTWASVDTANNFAIANIDSTVGRNSNGNNQFTSLEQFSANGASYGVPYRANYLPKVDPVAGTMTRVVTGISGGTTFRWLEAIDTPTTAVFVPYNKPEVGFFNKGTDSLNLVAHGATGAGQLYGGAALGTNGFVYMAPNNANVILKCDPVAETVATIAVPASLTGLTGLFRRGTSIGDWVVFAPYRSPNVLCIDTANNDDLYLVGDFSTLATNFHYWSVASADVFGQNVVYLTPWNAPRCLRLNTDLIRTDPVNALTEIGTLPGVEKFRDTRLTNRKLVSTPKDFPAIICSSTEDDIVRRLANVSVDIRGLSPPAPDTAAVPGMLIGLPYDSPYAVAIHPNKL